MPGKALAIFDFDGTIISGDSIVRYILRAMRLGYEPYWKLPQRMAQGLMGLWGLITPDRGKSLALSFLARMDASRQETFNRDFCRMELLPRLYPDGVERMKRHRESGCLILLVSASPDCYLKYLAEFLPVDVILASPTDERGRVAGSTSGQEKVRRVKAWARDEGVEIDWQASHAYGNSASDLPLLRLCGHPVCVNPSPSMRRQAGSLPREHWEE